MLEDRRSGALVFAVILVVLVLPVGYVMSGQFLGTVNNTVLAAPTPAGSSHLVQTTSRMIEREVRTGFCPSAVFWPGHIRFDVCGFQDGEQQIFQRVAMQLSDHLSREGPTSDRDPDLNIVLANVNRPNTWSLLFSSNNTASLLGSAVQRLDHFNTKLIAQTAGYYPRIDNLASLIGDLTSVLGSESHQLAEKAVKTGIYSMAARYAYFHTLGTMAATCWVLQAAKVDFEDVLKAQSALTIYDQAMDKTCDKIGKTPGIIINGSDLSHLLTLSGTAASAVNNLASLQTAIAAASHEVH
jgi:hypothetical protein